MTVPIQRPDVTNLVEDFERRILALERAKSPHPIGGLMLHAGATAPSGWLVCDGSAVSRVTYATLFAAIGTTFGVGDGSTTFNIPDLRGRVALGVSGSYALAAAGGEANHTLTSAEMPTHTHTDTGHNHGVTDPGHAHNLGAGSAAGSASHPSDSLNTGLNQYGTSTVGTGISIGSGNAANANTGGGGAHNNLQPYLALNYIIRY